MSDTTWTGRIIPDTYDIDCVALIHIFFRDEDLHYSDTNETAHLIKYITTASSLIYCPECPNKPLYSGVWAPKKIANPFFFEDKTPFASLYPISAIGIEMWTMTKVCSLPLGTKLNYSVFLSPAVPPKFFKNLPIFRFYDDQASYKLYPVYWASL